MMEPGYAEAITALAAVLIPVVAAAAKTNARKSWTAAVLSVAAAVLYEVSQGEMRPPILVLAALGAFTAQLAAYQGVWKHGRINEAVEAVRVEVGERLTAARAARPVPSDPVFGDLTANAVVVAPPSDRRPVEELPMSGITVIDDQPRFV